MDGAYLRDVARRFDRSLVDPKGLGAVLVNGGKVQTWAYDPSANPNTLLGRITYYDALPEDDSESQDLRAYWQAIELLDDVHLGFGELRGLKKRVRQKGVDTLIAVDMVAGAYSAIFDVAVLVAGDADFVPVVEAVKRRGVMVTVAAHADSASEDLRRVADRFVSLNADASNWPQFHGPDGRNWTQK